MSVKTQQKQSTYLGALDLKQPIFESIFRHLLTV